jgi:hypothetical protein
MTVPEKTRDYVPATDNPDYNPYVAYGQAASMTRIVGKLLKFTKFGEWIAGETNEEITLGTEMIAHMGELQIGWIKWVDGKPAEQVMGRVCDNFQPPRRSELGDTDQNEWDVDQTSGKPRDPWQFSNYLLLASFDNELYTYAASSRGGIQAIGKLSDEYGHAMRHRPDQFPMVRLGQGSYDHPNKAYGEIRFPVLEIVGWAPREDVDRLMDSKHAGGEQQQQIANTPHDEPSRIARTEPEPAQTRQAAPGKVSAPRPGATAPRTAPAQAPRQTTQNENRKTRF